MNTASHFFRSTTKIFKKGGTPHAKTKAHPEVVTSTKNIIQQKSKTRTTEQNAIKPCTTALRRSYLQRTLWHIVRIKPEQISALCY